MNKIVVLIIIISFLTNFACNSKNDNNLPQHFLIISIDALHPDAISKENSPFIFSLMERGWGIKNGKSIEPPLTLYNHAAMFTGLAPEKSGQKSNSWKKGEKRIVHETIFNNPFQMGMETSYFYSKPKLGYLVTDKIKRYSLSGLKTIEDAFVEIKSHQNTFTFLHVSGLDFSGKKDGWLSKPYMKIFKNIDHRLKVLIDYIIKKKRCIVIITSDHAGHGKKHGTDHPRDYMIPFIYYSDYKNLLKFNNYRSTDLKGIVEKLMK